MIRVLVVDDESVVRSSVARILVRAGFDCDEASSSVEAVALLKTCDAYEAALCDICMPGESGLDLARRVVADHPDIAIVMMTGQDDPKIATTAFEIGAFGYVTKPFTSNEILIALSGALRRRELEQMRTARNRAGGREITRSRALTGLVNEIECQGHSESIDSVEMIERLSRAVSLRDEETGRHIERMSRYAACLAARVGFSSLTPEEFRLAAALHDVGKIGVSDTILLKPGWLEPDELAAMRRHPEIGYRLLVGLAVR